MCEFDKGLHNLLVRCAKIEDHNSVLIIYEKEECGFCDYSVVESTDKYCAKFGIESTIVEIPFNTENPTVSPELKEQMAEADVIVFFARLADQLRFQDFPECHKAIINYASTKTRLASSFGEADFEGFCKLKTLVDEFLSKAGEIRVTCPRGTDFKGPGDILMGIEGDVTIIRFPMLVFSPISTRRYKGRVAIPGFLVGTGCNFYPNYLLELDETLFANFEGDHLIGFDGHPSDVKKAKKHLESISKRYNLNRDRVFSWHAGIHPGNVYPDCAKNNPAVWSSTCFGNPRILHFHTCGNYPPGEISWYVIDQTITVDGIELWKEGKFNPQELPGARELLGIYPDIKHLINNPGTEIGFEVLKP